MASQGMRVGSGCLVWGCPPPCHAADQTYSHLPHTSHALQRHHPRRAARAAASASSPTLHLTKVTRRVRLWLWLYVC